MVVVTRTHTRSSGRQFLLPGSTHMERISYDGPIPLLVNLPKMVTCLSDGPRLLPSTPSVAITQLFQAVSIPNPGPLCGTELWSLSFSTKTPPSPTEECLRFGNIGCGC